MGLKRVIHRNQWYSPFARFPKIPAYRRDLSQTYTVLSLVLLNNARPAEAQKACQRAIDMDPNNLQAKNLLAWSLASCADPALRNHKEAVALAKEAVERAKGNPETRACPMGAREGA